MEEAEVSGEEKPGSWAGDLEGGGLDPASWGVKIRVKIVNNKDDDDVGVNISRAKIGNVILLVSGSASRLHRMTGQM